MAEFADIISLLNNYLINPKLQPQGGHYNHQHHHHLYILTGIIKLSLNVNFQKIACNNIHVHCIQVWTVKRKNSQLCYPVNWCFTKATAFEIEIQLYQ